MNIDGSDHEVIVLHHNDIELPFRLDRAPTSLDHMETLSDALTQSGLATGLSDGSGMVDRDMLDRLVLAYNEDNNAATDTYTDLDISRGLTPDRDDPMRETFTNFSEAVTRWVIDVEYGSDFVPVHD